MAFANDQNKLETYLATNDYVHYGSNGNIKLASDDADVIQNVIYRRRMQYILNFPVWTNIPPKITQIRVNGMLLCSGNAISRFQVSVLTTVNLVHTLTLSVPLSSGGNGEVNIIPIGVQPQVPKPNREDDSWDAISQFVPTRRPPPTRTESSRPFNGDDNFWFDRTTRRPQIVVTNPSNRDDVPWEVRPQFEATTQRRPSATESITCGVSSITNSLVVRGRNITNGAHPWLGALFFQNNEGLKFICGSTLISKKHVVTAGHCIQSRRKRFRPDELWVVLGRENIQRWSNDGAQIIQTESVHIHSDFRFTTADGDIAVIVLSEEVVFSRFVRPACLWSGSADPRELIEKTGIVIGWGKDEHGQLVTSSPRQVMFPVVSEEECLRSNKAFSEITSNRTFCAGYRNNSGPCNGDSGGGFLIQVDGRWTLRGIVSMSLVTPDGNCDLRQYVVFSDIAGYMQWLLSFLYN
ncbi:hypothetical protein RI129_013005 [Pyrocoelia pectoralis]|uniref:Peptidase S1 domain-containing protein n=1 Tax=Pyrocoelia pectoralis TaxID=417401 RepID=A0AAN7UV76_9COLE